MSDIEKIVDALQQQGPTAAGWAVGLYTAKRVFSGTLDAVNAYLKEATERRLKNFAKISARAEELSADASGYVNWRTTSRVLNDATLYDDDVQQTYVAGLLAGSRNDDGSDDRPVFYLTLIDGLTASQLRLFHALYAAVAQRYHNTTTNDGPITNLIVVDVDELNANLSRMGEPEEGPGNGQVSLFALEHAGLIATMSMSVTPDNKGTLSFAATRIGAVLYDWAHGISDENIQDFGLRKRPDIGLPEMVYTSV